MEEKERFVQRTYFDKEDPNAFQYALRSDLKLDSDDIVNRLGWAEEQLIKQTPKVPKGLEVEINEVCEAPFGGDYIDYSVRSNFLGVSDKYIYTYDKVTGEVHRTKFNGSMSVKVVANEVREDE